MTDDSLLAQLADEFTKEMQAGKHADIEKYAQQYPELAERIRELFPTLKLLEGMAATGDPEQPQPPNQLGLPPGSTLGQFRLEREIGRGGMGIVYQAKDQKLGRDVAIKVLPEEFAKDADRVARFQREAKLLASLNHPNIASIYGLEESGDTHFLALELIEGDALADRIKAGPLAVEQSLKLAFQIAEALEAAHEKGVIHRDLKPANIKITPDGKAKVLDFGLAKAYAVDSENINLSVSPTLNGMDTMPGVVLGTAAYMSPEQVCGKPLDKKTDIWAFGVMLFEMLTGRSMFAGNDISQTLVRVLERQPDFSLLPANLHPRILLLLKRCLEKNSRDRYGSISDARVDIQQVLADPSGVFAQTVTEIKPRKKMRPRFLGIAAIAILCIILGGFAVWQLRPTQKPKVIRFDYHLPEDQTFTGSTLARGGLAVSADGTKIAYAANNQLYLKNLNELAARPIPGTDETPQWEVFSPDGQGILYQTPVGRQLKKIPISGGAPKALCEIPAATGIGKWSADDTIVYGQDGGGIRRISTNGGTPELLVKMQGDPGGTPELLVKLQGYNLAFPQILPDGKSVLATHLTQQSFDNAKIIVKLLGSGDWKELFAGAAAQYLPTGHLVYLFANNLFAVPFNLDKLEVTGEQVRMIEGVSEMVISDSGTLVYRPETGPATTSKRTLVWVNREGKEEPISAPPNMYRLPKVSPDGTEIAVSVSIDGNFDIYTWEPVGENLRRLTFDTGEEAQPLWTPDGKRIVFYSIRDDLAIYWKAADGTGEKELLSSAPDLHLYPWSWADAGRTLVTVQASLDFTDLAIGTLSMEGDGTHETLIDEEYLVGAPRISPDGRYIAYLSTEDSKREIYVRPFPEVTGGKWLVSEGGGMSPLWSPDGKELFYLALSGDAVMVVQVETEPSFKRISKPKEIFRGNYVTGYRESPEWDIHPDGDRFLMIKPGEITDEESAEYRSKINIVLNWFEELKERIPLE